MRAVFLRALEESIDKAAVLRAAANAPAQAFGRTRFEVVTETFGQVPRSPFAYWVSDRVRSLFAELPAFESEGRTARQGLATADDFRFVRLWTEVDAREISCRWYPLVKGGRFSPFYADVPSLVDWADGGKQLGAFAGSVIRNPDYYLRPGLTWPLRGIRFSAQAVPEGCVFSVAGKMAFGDATDLPWLHGLFNAKTFDVLIGFFAGKIGGVQYEVGLIQSVPVPVPIAESRDELEGLAARAWALKRSLDTSGEHSHAYHLPALLLSKGKSFDDSASNWFTRAREVEQELCAIHAKIDTLCFGLYSINETERQRIEQGFGGELADVIELDGEDTEDGEANDFEAAPMMAALMSWTVGVSFGRFDLRLATGELPAPPIPKPFDPLLACSPSMLVGDDGLPLTVRPAGYPIDFPRDGILVDDPGTTRDLVTSCRRAFEVLFDNPVTRWEEASSLLEDRDTGLRTWFAKQYFERHIRCYSTCHRKSPIYWQLATPSASYSIWLYYHRFTRDTLFRVLNDHVVPKLQHEEGKLTALQQDSGPNPPGLQRRAVDAQHALVGELRSMRDEVARVAPLWNPSLDDGVILNFAPLWRLVPQHSAWQRECKSTWDQLCKGEYDWAHLAMHLWPERVVPKCAKDRSLAIAHGLEGVFWRECAGGTWQERPVSAEEVRQLVEERTSVAVKEALRSLSEAPTPATGRRSGTQRRVPARRTATQPSPKQHRLFSDQSGRRAADPYPDQAVLILIERSIVDLGGEAAKADILAATGLSDGNWIAAIKALLADGRVIKTGEKRGTRYHLAGGVS